MMLALILIAVALAYAADRYILVDSSERVRRNLSAYARGKVTK
jgi:hypothetical protein